MRWAIAEATRLGLPTRIVTNAYWATSLPRAREKLRQLVETSVGTVHSAS
jgi:hypothetical protein